MRYQESFIKTNKDAKEFDSVNATLLQKGGFVDQTMAGVYTFLPLGWRVLAKIENIVRQEMDKVGAELFMPSIVPQKLWETTGRLQTVDVLFSAQAANDGSKKRNDATYVLNSTHEEVITPIAKRIKPSYRDLPFAVYQIQTKFRNEERPKSGLLRGREFRMKDLYSFHTNDEDRKAFYDNVKDVYMTIFSRIGIGDDTVIALAAGGDFTKDFTHEFQTKCETGEDTIFYDEKNDTHYNKEVVPEEVEKAGVSFSASEVGNIFPLGTKFTSAFEYTYTDESGTQQPIYMASYGIGTSRILGLLVEKFHDDAGIIWPAAVAPFQVYLACLQPDTPEVYKRAQTLYDRLTEAGIEVLFDDRTTAGPGEKLGDADLLGIPWRAVVSERTGEQVELKNRSASETENLSVDALIEKVQG